MTCDEGSVMLSADRADISRQRHRRKDLQVCLALPDPTALRDAGDTCETALRDASGFNGQYLHITGSCRETAYAKSMRLNMSKHFSITRGIQRVYATHDPVALIQQINAGLSEFKADHKAQLNDLQGQIADVAAKAAARGLGGNADGPMNGNRREVSAALRSLIRDGDDGPLASLTPQAGMSVGSDPDGGYSVIPTFSQEMTRRVFELSPMRQLARNVAVSSDAFEELNDLAEAEAQWVGETEARPETATPNLGKLRIPVHEVYAMPKITQKLLDDSQIDLGTWLVAKCSQRFARKEGNAFVNGDGILKPRGLLTYPTALTDDDTRPWGTIQHVNTGASGAFGAGSLGGDKLIEVTYTLKAEYRGNARWLMNRATAAVVRKLKDGDGNYLWQSNFANGVPDRLLGFEVVLDEEMPNIEDGSMSIAFGDFREAYTIANRHGLRLLRDPFSAKPHVLFYCYMRTGGDVSNFEAVKLVRFGTA